MLNTPVPMKTQKLSNSVLGQYSNGRLLRYSGAAGTDLVVSAAQRWESSVKSAAITVGCRVVLEVNQPSGSNPLLEVDQQPGSQATIDPL